MLVALMNQTATFWAGGLQRAEIRIGKFAGFDALDHQLRLLRDVRHELVALQAAVLHFLELEFPFAGELRRADFVHLQLFQRKQ